MNIGKILVVDDEPDICVLIKEILEDEGFQVTIAENGGQARTAMEKIKPTLVLLDIWMPDIDGISLLKEWTQTEFNTPVIMMSGHGTVETAVEATRLGAYDFLEKPLSMAKLLLTVKNAIKASWLQRENQKLLSHSSFPLEITGKSETIENLRNLINRIADHDTPVLIIGEAGTDKEAVARYLHYRSNRKSGPFVAVNISALSSEDPSAEIFGSVIGGDVHTGFLDDAKDGTLFLKDIAELDMNTQAKLLNALEKGTLTRVGGGAPSEMNVRVIAATRTHLDEAVKNGNFRDDLYFKLNVVPVVVPPLRDHFEDVPELLEYYVNFFVDQEKLPYRHFTTSAQNRLRRHSWPGNIRELKNLVQRMLILGQSDTIDVKEVEAALGEQSGYKSDNDLRNFDLPLRDAREKFEKAYLEYQLKQANGSVSKIAQVVGMERTHLYRKLKLLGIEIKN
jgi:DNA-binding NtrC family response regulator